MSNKPTYEELEQKVLELEKDAIKRIETEAELIESRERLDLALKSTELGIWDYDITQDEWVFDELSVEFFGSYPKNNSEFNLLIHPDDIGSYYKDWKALKKGEYATIVSEYRLKSKTDQYIWLLEKGKVVEWNSDKEPIRAIGTIQDITQQKKAEKALIESEKNLKRAQHISKIGSWYYDLVHKTEVWSDECFKLYGIKKDDYPNNIVPESLSASVYANALKNNPFESMAEKYDTYKLELTTVPINGEVKTIHSYCEVEKDDTGRATKIFGIDRISPTTLESDNAFTEALVQSKPSGTNSGQQSSLDQISGKSYLSEIKGNSTCINQLKEKVLKIALTSSTVLLKGETGTGKDLFAKAIHLCGNRRHQSFTAINCAAIPESLLESELFGYEAGAFTGSSKNGKSGYFELANHGTLFLDEIGDMPLNLQTKLLRVLQDKVIQRIGGRNDIPLDVRIVAATNQDIKEMVAQSRFRKDLYYRLNVIPFDIPPLRERKEDIEILALHFLEKYRSLFPSQAYRFSEGCLPIMQNYEWPGNVRELEHVVEYAVNMETEGVVSPESLPPEMKMAETGTPSLRNKSSNLEKKLIEDTLNQYGWDVEGKKKAAKKLKIGLRTLYRKINKFKIEEA
jgi:transcriptional regulator with PAS, ATPase and Fis domain